jgi:dUTP pyrophosphatase
MEIKVLRKLKHQLLLCSTESSTGKEMRSNLDNDVVLYFMGRLPVQTDLFIDNTKGYEAQIRRESRLALKNGITVLNSPGAIDADYRG